MKNTTKNTTILFGVVLITLYTIFSSLAYAHLGVRLDSETNINSSIDGDDGEINTDLDTKLDTDIKVDSNLDTSTDVKVNTNDGAGAISNSDVKDNTEINTEAIMKVNISGVAITTSAQVNSEDDLKIFSSNISSRNKVVASVDISSENTPESKVTIIYKHKGKFFGFIPTIIESTTVIEVRKDTKIEVKSNLPWWSFLITVENYNMETLGSSIKNNTKVQANAKVNASAKAKARVAEAVIAELQANATMQVKANTDIK